MEITVFCSDKEYKYSFESPIKLSDAIINSGIAFAMPCGGAGKCGKCAVKASGKLSEMTENEKNILGEKAGKGYRLACKAYATGDCVIIIDKTGDYSGITDFDISYESEPMTENDDCFAGVVDIGTTTVASYLYKMPECELIAYSVGKNEQISFGADVVSRISYAAKNGTNHLSEIIKNQIEKAFSSFGKAPKLTVITGNTAMLHFYKNLPCSSLASSPFEPYELFGYSENGVCIPRCISAFVGADITCGVISSGMMSKKKSMLIDIGTNCEIVYKNDDEYICCSASAGPAFEGANIKNGMPSADGAINKVYNIGNKFEYTVIGKSRPVGICGSGLVDCIASMLRAEVIDKTGYLENDFYIGNSGICVTPEDIRAVQTAKAAVAAAIETVCGDLSEVEKFYLSGSFGNYLNTENAVTIGLLPKEMKNKTVLCGNTSAAGASLMLFDKRKFHEANEIAKKARTIQLASNDEFYKKYISHINF